MTLTPPQHDCPDELDKSKSSRSWTYNKRTITDFGKDCFNNFKKEWKVQTYPEKKERKEELAKATRWAKRRADVSELYR